ncbi:hypothetical protein IAG41_07995 [Sphingomonas sp. JC676]|uniref:hypothetical protein n=1 Tax=Sphingomonas sp. JC676 TaxID=2768065 RepID=UPI0016582492|nr:hypothetical protein [Sphingomonas sp. JC676]MBC9032329.1 hypothetical protein [Sphingomonas sp. JC676]
MISTIARTATVFAAVALVAGASLPAAAASDPTAKTSEAKPPKEKRYCVTQATTGSMLRKDKVCKTRDQWIAETGQDPARK